ncbi:protein VERNALIZATION INSENSITIVE 3 isoform X1 [Canna indica]|uniref:Protein VERNALIZATION INSENSITIVE 3 isoform X1 n=1 Tax=Canna indica TaxID=4628 RepID=A0AAQ3JM02_9LILI|nr:protein VERNALIZATION INSENSITIVE 3 isoform X1 [Canna indica]
MDPPFSGYVLDPSKCRMLSIEEKRELIRELSKWPDSAPDKLQTWSRRDLLEILCAEIGKERKYTGLSKQKMIEHLFKVVSEKKSAGDVATMKPTPNPSPPNPQTPQKRQRKNDHPSRLPILANDIPANCSHEAVINIRYCQNLACRAILNLEDSFCKRCSCCICHKYDDNKDPSLWLVCSSEILYQGNSCGLSCHLECALKHESAGIVKSEKCTSLDGSYYCTYCAKVNDLLGCWKKQLMIAKDARRVDVLCYRISLSHKILCSTEKYQSLHEIVDSAMKKLEAEVGPINDLPNMARGIVNRLSVGAEVQRMCALAVNLLDSMHSGALSINAQFQHTNLMSSSFIKFEGISPTLLTLVLDFEDNSALSLQIDSFTIWHRRSETKEYLKEPTCTLSKSKRRFLMTELTPATEYMFKVVAFSSLSELARWEVVVTTEATSTDDLIGLVPEVNVSKLHCPSHKTNSSGLSNPSEGDESDNNGTIYTDLNKSPESCFHYFEKPEILDLEKFPDHIAKDTIQQKSEYTFTISGVHDIEPEETPGHSGSALDEEPNSTIQADSHRDSTKSAENNQASDIPKSDNESNAPNANERVIVALGDPDQTLPAIASRLDSGKEGSGRGIKLKPCINLLESDPANLDREPASTTKKRGREKISEICAKDGTLEGSFEYCVKVVRWLECEGHIETSFRVKFLTWFSLHATPQERRIVTVYVDTLIDDPASLAGQLVDTFSDTIRSKKPPMVQTGFCMKIWH